jgi:O-antigen/teichoic acid export membrane protein
LVRTFELVYWGTGAVIGIAVVFLAPLIARYWINSGEVGPETVEYALMIMGMSIAFQWPGGIYSGGLMGLQRQVVLNFIRSVVVTIQHVGAAVVLLFISPSITAFFTWQALMGLVATIALREVLWKCLPRDGREKHLLRAVFSKALLSKNWRFATGVSGIALTTVLLTQVDKVILSKMLTLETFGYYMLAFTVASTLNNLVSPIAGALQPRFTQLVLANDQMNLISAFRKGCQLLSVTLLPIAITITLFSQEILILWLGDDELSDRTYLLLALLVTGTSINALVALPYSLQLAFAYTRLVFYANVVAVIVLVPLMVWMTTLFQSVGATAAWLILNVGYLLILVPLMYRQWKLSGLRGWYKTDILLPGVVVFLIVLAVRMLLPVDASRGVVLLSISVAITLSVGGAVLVSNQLNKYLLEWWKSVSYEKRN